MTIEVVQTCEQDCYFTGMLNREGAGMPPLFYTHTKIAKGQTS